MTICRGNFILAVMTIILFGCGYICMVDAAVIAQWQFGQDDPATPENEFLLDSSGNGNTLANYGVSCVGDLTAIGTGNHVASFNGASWLQTANALDLSPYSALRISWWQKVNSDVASILWEHSETFLHTPGSIVADVNDAGPGEGFAGVWSSDVNTYNLDKYPHSYDNTWEHMAVEFNLVTDNAEDITKVFRNGNLVSVATGAQAANLVPFLNDTFYIGARGGNSVFYTGSLDGLTIESIPTDPVVPVIPPIEHDSVKLYILAGQSNMMGQYADKANLPVELQGEQSDVVVFCNGQWTTLHPGIGSATPNDFGPEVTFGRTMADSVTGESIVLVKYAVGATTLADNWNSTTPGPLYTGLINTVNEAVAALSEDHDVEIAGMIWMQGESDAMVHDKALAYEANFQNFVQDIREDLAVSDLPIAIGQIASDSAWTDYTIVHQAVDKVVAAKSKLVAFSTDDLPTMNHHYNSEGQRQLGERFANALIRMAAIPGDANNDGKVDGSDVTILAGNWQAGVGTSAASVPEPSTIVLLFGVLAGLAILRRVKK